MAVEQEEMTVSALRERSGDLWNEMVGHPFLLEVEQDRLPDEKLLHYFMQNVHYIDAAITFCAQAAAKAPTEQSRALCLDLCRFGLEEIERQRGYVHQLSKGRQVDWEIAASCHAYTNHLLSVAAYEGTLELLVALMPCSWSYDEFGSRLCSVVRHPITSAWLENFGGDDHNDITRRYHEAVNDLARTATPERLERLHELFRIGCRYEWMFWEMAYKSLKWPV
jgi:thiaminase/transcriptional activator TenA